MFDGIEHSSGGDGVAKHVCVLFLHRNVNCGKSTVSLQKKKHRPSFKSAVKQCSETKRLI